MRTTKSRGKRVTNIIRGLCRGSEIKLDRPNIPASW